MTIDIEPFLLKTIGKQLTENKDALSKAEELFYLDILSDDEGLWFKDLILSPDKCLCFVLFKKSCYDLRYFAICDHQMSKIHWSSLRTLRQCDVMLLPSVQFASYVNQQNNQWLHLIDKSHSIIRQLGGTDLTSHLEYFNCRQFISHKLILPSNVHLSSQSDEVQLLKHLYYKCVLEFKQELQLDSSIQKRYKKNLLFSIHSLPYQNVLGCFSERKTFIVHALHRQFVEIVERCKLNHLVKQQLLVYK